MDAFHDNAARVRDRIAAACRRAGREPSAVKLLAVTKTVPLERVRAAFDGGHRAFGENYAQEALPKVAALPGAEWHFIGKLQGNKAKDVAGRFALLHSMDRESLARELDRRCALLGASMSVLLEVNLAGEATKGGVTRENAPVLAEFIATRCPALRVEGLMAFPPPGEDSRPYYRDLAALARAIDARRFPGVAMRELSMGVSDDFETAVEEGATLVRLGTVLFGARS